jgi:hypothetical protein
MEFLELNRGCKGKRIAEEGGYEIREKKRHSSEVKWVERRIR